MTDQPRPRPGDAVRVTSRCPWQWGYRPNRGKDGAGAFVTDGDIGMIGGLVGATPVAANIIFNFSAFNNGHIVSCSGGPGAIYPSLSQLRYTGETVKVRFWKWKDGLPGAGRGEDYEMEVPVWEW